MFNHNNVLITDGTGSFGKALVLHLLKKYKKISKLVILLRDELKQYEMKKILAQIGIKCKLNKNEMKIFGKGMIDASDKKIFVGNLGDHRIAMCSFILAILNLTFSINGLIIASFSLIDSCSTVFANLSLL